VTCPGPLIPSTVAGCRSEHAPGTAALLGVHAICWWQCVGEDRDKIIYPGPGNDTLSGICCRGDNSTAHQGRTAGSPFPTAWKRFDGRMAVRAMATSYMKEFVGKQLQRRGGRCAARMQPVLQVLRSRCNRQVLHMAGADQA
jgi:hypothetical protein